MYENTLCENILLIFWDCFCFASCDGKGKYGVNNIDAFALEHEEKKFIHVSMYIIIQYIINK